MRQLIATSLIQGNQEALQQWQALLALLDETQYVSAPPPVEFGIGRHLRHVLDMYRALRSGVAVGEVNYELRSRDSDIERDIGEAMHGLAETQAWLSKLGEDRSLHVHTRVSVVADHIETLDSSLSRELAFVANHSVHHLAYAVVLARLQGCVVDDSLGLAPATVHAEALSREGRC